MELYDQFSSGLCKDVLDGSDLLWASLACIFILSIVIIVLSLVLARCDYEGLHSVAIVLHSLLIFSACEFDTQEQ